MLPSDPGWEDSKGCYNTRIEFQKYQPLAVVFCQTSSDVIAVGKTHCVKNFNYQVNFAREHKISVRIRSGWHCYEGN